jgi:hypothetical protein
MDSTTALIVIAIWLICGVGAYLITAQKGRDDAGSAGILAVLLGPIGLVSAAMARPADPARVGRVCASCGKVVAQERDRLCNHCGQPFAR